VRLWDCEAIRQAATLPRHWAAVTDCLAFADGRRVISVSRDQTARLWELSEGHELATLGRHPAEIQTGAVAPDGSEIACGFRSDPYHPGAVWLWDAGTLVPRAKLPAGGDWNGALAYSLDGSRLLVAGDRALLWNRRSSQFLPLSDSRCAAWAPEGRRFATGGATGTLTLRDARDGGELGSFPGRPDSTKGLTACCFSPDGTLLVSTTGEGWLTTWDVRSGVELSAFQAHGGRIQSCAFSPDGRTIRTVADGDGVALWDARTGTPLPGPGGAVGAFSPGGEWIALGTGRGLLIAEVRTGREVARLPLPDDALSVAWTVRRLVAGDGSGTVAVLELRGLPRSSPIATATYAYQCEEDRWAERPSASCGWCGARVAIPSEVLAAITAIGRKGGASGDEVSCLTLPDEAWDDPRLRFACPSCGETLRCNPFAADARSRPYPAPDATRAGWRSLYEPERFRPERGEPLPLDTAAIDPLVVRLVPARLCREHALIPIRIWKRGILIAVAEPIPERVVDQLEFVTGRELKLTLAPRAEIEAALLLAHS
jgi:hypothetical protein